MNKSILLIGRISSGKSTLAKAVQVSVPNCRIVSFGRYLMNYSEERNWKIDRKSLQDLGQKFIDDNTVAFLQNVVEYNQAKDDEILLFEGVRHKSILRAISTNYPVVLSIFLDVDAQTRYNRYVGRDKSIDKLISWEEFLKADNHKVELEIESLKNDCDLILGDKSLADNINVVKKSIER